MILLEEDIDYALSKEELGNVTDYWDQFCEIVPLKWNPIAFNKIKAVISQIYNRNYQAVPNPFILPGVKILINTPEKNDILEAIGISMNKGSNLPYALDLVKNSRFFNAIAKDDMQKKLAFFLPLVCYSSFLNKLGKVNESKIIMNFLAVAAYTSSVVSFFYSKRDKITKIKSIHSTEINHDVMTHVVEQELNNKSAVKSKTIIEILQTMTDISFNNYANKNRYFTDFPITDKKLNEITSSGIITRVNEFVKKIAKLYFPLLTKSKTAGFKIVKYAETSSVSKNSDTGDAVLVSKDYKSNSSVIEELVTATLTYLHRPDPEVAEKAVRLDLGLTLNNKDKQIKQNQSVKMPKVILEIIEHIIENYSAELPVLLRAILYAYLFDNRNGSGSAGFKKADIGFIRRAMKAFNNNRLDKNVAIIKKKMNLFLNGVESENEDVPAKIEYGSKYYIESEKTTRINVKKYIYKYFVLSLWFAYKNMYK